MRDIDIPTANALAAAPEQGLIVRNLVWFRVRGLQNPSTVAEFAFWNDLDQIQIDVIDAKTGQIASRVYVGDGSLMDMEPIPLTSDLSIRTVRVPLSQIHPSVQAMVRGYDVRFGEVQIHRAVIDPTTRLLVGRPLPHFVGRVDKAPLGTPRVSEEGGVELECVSDTRELTRTNPAKKSDETQKRRSGDRFYRYTGTANIPIYWGSEKDRTKK